MTERLLPTPPDPMGSFEEAAVMMHFMFGHYIAAGFTEMQAAVLLGTWLAVSTSSLPRSE